MTLEALGHIIATSTWMDHSAHHLDINNVGELAWFLQVVEALHLHHLTGYLVRYLATK